MTRLLTRRRLLMLLGGLAAGGAYSFGEARWLRATSARIPLPRLPEAFSGLRVALLSDFHHSSSVPLSYVRRAVQAARGFAPDVICLGGDYVAWRKRYIAPCLEALGALRAPLGVFAVLGNHDHLTDAGMTRVHLKRNGLVELTNRGVWLERGGARLRLGGVGDLWHDTQDLEAAVGDCGTSEGAIVLSHNPDFAEEMDSDRVDLLLAGHTHGGQVRVPGLGAPYIPSRFGQKYAFGLVRGPCCLVYVTRGVGTVGPPVRFACRPEICLLELVCG